MRFVFRIFCLYIAFTCFAASAEECVIILHGFAKTSRSMERISSFLTEHNYKVVNVNYPSIKKDIINITEQHIKPLVQPCIDNAEKVHFIGYSMGGVITRHIIENNKISNLGNVVLIASPIQGSDLSTIIVKNDALRWFFGPAVRDIHTDSPLIKGLMPEPPYPIGIIQANRSHNPLTSLLIFDGPNDGTVTLASTQIKTATDTITLRANHTSILHLPDTKQQILHFLRHQKFAKIKLN